jgi:hypothetical protein
LQGITFYTPSAAATRVFVNKKPVVQAQKNPADYTGGESVSIPLQKLENMGAMMRKYRDAAANNAGH